MGTDYQVVVTALEKLDEPAILKAMKDFIADKPGQDEAALMLKACTDGMAKVGDLFEQGEYYVGDLIFAGDVLKNAINDLKPYLGDSSAAKLGKIVLGSAPGDLHDIGKNIFGSMAEAAGFEVFDLGVDVSPEVFVAKAKETGAQIVGVSGLLTQSLETMKDVVDAFAAAGLKGTVKILIGGNPTNESFRAYSGADAFSNSAPLGVKQCKAWVGA